MIKKKTLGIIIDVVFVIAIIFTAIFLPLYYRTGGPVIDEVMYLEIENIECTDKLNDGSYILKVSLINKRSFEKLPIGLEGEELWNYTTDFNVSKKVPNYLKSQEGRVIFVKLQRGLKSEIIKIEPYEMGLFFDYYDLWFNKFGGEIRIKLNVMTLW
ncbi:MAG: hypothetical protein FK731_08710 [Asgard group archaeon]|nr:hypothetical protein [Asgard group archaeon]